MKTGCSPILLRIEESGFLNRALTSPDQWDWNIGTCRIQDTLDEDSKVFGNIIFLTLSPSLSALKYRSELR